MLIGIVLEEALFDVSDVFNVFTLLEVLLLEPFVELKCDGGGALARGLAFFPLLLRRGEDPFDEGEVTVLRMVVGRDSLIGEEEREEKEEGDGLRSSSLSWVCSSCLGEDDDEERLECVDMEPLLLTAPALGSVSDGQDSSSE